MILVKCFLPDEKPEIIPFPLQSVSDKGDFTFNKATLISVENEHYKLNIAPSCILIKASGQKGFFYATQTLRFLLPPAINSPTQVEIFNGTYRE